MLSAYIVLFFALHYNGIANAAALCGRPIVISF